MGEGVFSVVGWLLLTPSIPWMSMMDVLLADRSICGLQALGKALAAVGYGAE